LLSSRSGIPWFPCPMSLMGSRDDHPLYALSPHSHSWHARSLRDHGFGLAYAESSQTALEQCRPRARDRRTLRRGAQRDGGAPPRRDASRKKLGAVLAEISASAMMKIRLPLPVKTIRWLWSPPHARAASRATELKVQGRRRRQAKQGKFLDRSAAHTPR
jgi:hypothetical protein